MTVKRYRKKPLEIEAVQWTGSNSNEIFDFFGDKPDLFYIADGCVFIDTLEDWTKASAGWYVVKGIAGEFYPMHPDIFEQSYDEITSDKIKIVPRKRPA